MHDATKRFREDEAALLFNARVVDTDEAEIRGGSMRAHALAINGGEPCYGAARFNPTVGDVQWVAMFGDQAYYSTDQGVTWNLIAGTGALLLEHWDFTTLEIGNVAYLYAVNGDANIKKWDGANWTTIAGPGAGVKRIETYNDRLYVWGHNGLEVAACAPTDDTAWSLAANGIAFNAQTHDGDEQLTGFFSLHRLLVFKPTSTGLSDGAGMDDLIVEVGEDGVSRSVGCVAHRTIVGAGDKGVCFLSSRGIEFYRAGAGLVNLTRSLRTFMQSIGWDVISALPGGPCAYYRPLYEEVVVALPGGASEQNDYRVVIKLSRIDEGVVAVALWKNSSASDYTVYTDELGYLQVQRDGTRDVVRVVSDYFEIAGAGVAGAFVDLDADSYLEIGTAGFDPAAMIVADRAGEKDAPVEFGYDGFVRYADYGDRDDVLVDGTGGIDIGGRVITRDMPFENYRLMKKIEEVELFIASPAATTVTAAIHYDGAVGGDVQVPVSAASGGKARRVRFKPKPYEAIVHQVEIRSSQARLRVAAIIGWAHVVQGVR
jgi:hypothetical protein